MKRRGYFASLPASGVFIGIGLAAAMSAAVAALPKDQLMSWGWHVPFCSASWWSRSAKTVALIAVLVGCAVGALVIPLLGTLSDRLGRKPVYIRVSAFCALVSFPFFWMLDTRNVALIVLAFALALGGCLAMSGSQAAYYSELFPGAVLAGPAPVISVGLVSLGGGSPTLLEVAMVVVAVAGLLAVLALPETCGVDLAPIVQPDQMPATLAPAAAARSDHSN